MSDRRVLVVGTTSDYIDMIDRRYPGRVLFLTDFKERRSAHEAAPAPGAEVLCDLTAPAAVAAALHAHLENRCMTLTGVACYDCEAMALASRLAGQLHLDYPALPTILLLRDKFRTKEAWQRAGVPCPKAAVVTSEREARGFRAVLDAPVVIKPLTGSGSELTFKCDDDAELVKSFRIIKDGLAKRASSRMYTKANATTGPDPLKAFAIEEFIEGPEYSCDFIVENGRAAIIRTACKIRDTQLPFGTTLAYELPAFLPAELTEARLTGCLYDAARAARLERAVCMVDFIVRDGLPLLLELTPRPGGDCLPFLIRQSCGLDMLGLALDFAEGEPVSIPVPEAWRHLLGVRLFAPMAGRLREVDFSDLNADPVVRECYLKRAPGHVITLPPDDYDSWMLGHVVFSPSAAPLLGQCHAVAARARLDIQPNNKTSECYHGVRRESASTDTPA